jgi:hypothetical protein
MDITPRELPEARAQRAGSKKAMTAVPYEGATSGMAAWEEITKGRRRFGCESVGFMDDFDNHSVFADST